MADSELQENWRRRERQEPAMPAADPIGRLVRQVGRGALVYGALVFLVTAFFVHGHRLSPVYLCWATPLGVLFGLLVAGFDRLALLLRTFLAARCNPFICGFLLFFAYVLGYLVLFSLVVTYPVGILIERGSGSTAMAIEYGLSTLNVILLFAVLGWLDWKRFVASRVGGLPWPRGCRARDGGWRKNA